MANDLTRSAVPSMRVYVSPRQAAHDPRNFLVAGRVRANPDVPARIERLMSGIAEQGHILYIKPSLFGAVPVDVHPNW